MPIHPPCGKSWTGLRREHCPACHETFNSASAGDAHRRGPFGVGRRCVPPREAGLIPVVHGWGTVWQFPGADPRGE